MGWEQKQTQHLVTLGAALQLAALPALAQVSTDLRSALVDVRTSQMIIANFPPPASNTELDTYVILTTTVKKRNAPASTHERVPRSFHATPRLMIQALRDPGGANLDRVQVVIGWLDATAALQEEVIDVACSDDRLIVGSRCDGTVSDIGNVETATVTNDIGGALLIGYWEDPDFDPAERAFYYDQALEIPTPRWTTYDAAFFGVERSGGATEPSLYLTDLVRARVTQIKYSARESCDASVVYQKNGSINLLYLKSMPFGKGIRS